MMIKRASIIKYACAFFIVIIPRTTFARLA